LAPEYFEVYARYLQKSVAAYTASGIPIYALSLINEPHALVTGYPAMWMDSSDQSNLIATIGRLNLLTNVRILAWDHNWNEYDYPLEVLGSNQMSNLVQGSAFHCYAGDVSAQSKVHDAFPEREIHFTECSGVLGSSFAGDLIWNMENLIIGAPTNWASSVILWNLALDQKGGPHLGGCNNCRGVVTILPDNTIEHNVEYYALAHYGKAVRSGARRVKSSISEANTMPNLHQVAFLNPDGSGALIVLNKADSEVTFKVRLDDQSAIVTVPAKAAATFGWY
jgi:glucosylceramidase